MEKRASCPSIEHAPGRRVGEPQEQPRDRRLPGPARPDQREHLVRADLEIDAAQRLARGLRIREPHALEAHLAAPPARRERIGRIGGRRLLVEELDHPLGRGRGRVQPGREPAHPADRAEQLRQVREEDEQAAQRQRALRELQRPVGHHEQPARELDQVDERPERRAQPRRGHLRAERRAVLLVEARRLGRLAPVGLDEGHVREALLGDGPDRPRPPPLLARRALEQLRRPPRGDVEERRDDEGDQREVPLQPEQRGDEERDPQRSRTARRRRRRGRTTRSPGCRSVSRDRTSPSRRPSKKSSGRRCRWA